MANPSHRSGGLMLIAAFKLLYATLLMVIGFGALHLVHRDVTETALRVVNHFRADPDSRYIHALLSKITNVTPRRLEVLGVGAFAYGVLFLIEGGGLLLGKRWAEWLTVLSGSSLIPLEIYETVQHVRWGRVVVLVLNIAIVIYLVRELRRKQSTEAAPA